MSMLHRTALFVAVLTLLLLLVGCRASRTDNTPTPDSNAVRTAAAATVNARLTEMGPRTAIPSTTPYITRTMTPEVTPNLPGLQTNTPVSLMTATNPASPDVAEWISQSPADYTSMAPGAAFKMTWTLKNTGKSTWTRTYQLRFFANNPLGGPAAVNLSRDVLPGEMIDITIDLVAPGSPGDYHSIWVLTSDKTGNFYPVDIWIKVGSAPAATQTTAPTTPAVIDPTATSASED
jgi:hypothetical protein